MSGGNTKAKAKAVKLAHSARLVVEQLGAHLDLNLWVILWDGSHVPIGRDVSSDLAISISEPGVIASLLRRPTLDRLLRHYLHGKIEFQAGTLIEFGEQVAFQRTGSALKNLKKWPLFKALLPFLFTRAVKPEAGRSFAADEVGDKPARRDEKDFIRFHYDVSNAFYELFLDPRMIYTCAYFTDWDHSLERAQEDKLEMICRKLRLKPGDRLLDIGCGWGGLLCYAAEHYGIEGVGVTLSEEQYELALERIAERGLADRLSIELKDYRQLEGKFDKITSIGMYEAIGVAAIPEYLSKIHRLLKPDGLFLNHGITRRAKKKNKRFARRPEQRALLRYVFPGGELDDIGNTIGELEKARFEVHDVENWRPHYAQTTKLWCQRLSGKREQAVEIAGEAVYRVWVAYLAGCSLAFQRGTANIYQTVASPRRRGPAPLPSTRDDLYRDPPPGKP